MSETRGIRIKRRWQWHPIVQWVARVDWIRRALKVSVIRDNRIINRRIDPLG